MLRKSTIVFLLTLFAAVAASAHGNLKFINGRWFDGTRFVAKTMYSVDNVFRATYDGEARTIDLAGHYVVPPFADAHNHAFADGANVDEQRARFLRAGIFYVKNPNSSIKGTAAIRSRMNTPETVDVLYANGGLTTKGGHPTQIYDRFGPGMSDNAYFIVDSTADLDRVWPLIRAGKPDFIKLYLEHSEDPKKRRGLDPALLPSIVERIHREGLRATVHVASAADFHIALTSGVDEITHLPLAPIDPKDAELAAKMNVTLVTTTLSHRANEGIADLAALHRANLALLKRAGVNVVLGVDGDRTVIDEIESVRALKVYSDLELLQMLTSATPRAIFPQRKFAKLDDGSEVSFLALDGNPLEDFRAIRRIATRVKQGHVLEIAPEKRSVAEAMMPIVMTKGIDAAIAEYRRLERDEANAWDFSEPRLNQLGYALLNHNRNADAVAILQLNAEKFPKSSNAWDSLAEAHMLGGRRELAIENYRKALELNPNNKNAADMLKKLLSQ